MSKSIHQEPYRLLCSLLIARRKSLGLSQYELANRLNRPQSFVAKVERHERRLDVIEFLSFAKELAIDPCEIIRALQEAYVSPSEDSSE
ncbi:MAG: helix-turn-helix transcriptional regulator [Anaerolineae bacterium]|nr:helix-turn-helix transcriptional regulator [Anaerolineae bacterium]